MALLPAPFCATPLPKTLMPLRIWLPLSSPTLLTLFRVPEWQHRVSRLGSSSACSSLRSCIVTAGRVDMNPPSGVICLRPGRSGLARVRGCPGLWDPPGAPVAPDPNLVYVSYRTFCSVITVQYPLAPGLCKGYGLRPRPIGWRRLGWL